MSLKARRPTRAHVRMTDRIATLRKEIRVNSPKSRRAGSGSSLLATSLPTAPGASGGAHGDGDPEYAQKLELLDRDLKRRQESYIRREQEYKSKIMELEEQLEQARAASAASATNENSAMLELRRLHQALLENVEQVKGRTSHILQEQERDLLRAFRARLFDVQTELEQERSKSDDGASVWIEKNRQLEKDLDWAKEMADRLERVNQALTRENARLKTEFKTQEDDREFLIRQLVAAKKDNARLRQELERAQQERDTAAAGAEEGALSLIHTQSTSARGGTRREEGAERVLTPKSSAQMEQRYKDVIRRLRRLLDAERRSLRQARAAYTAEVQQRTELEGFLRQCIDDVRTEIARRRTQMLAPDSRPHTMSGRLGADASRSARLSPRSARSGAPGSAEEMPLWEFSRQDRERVMELLLSQERVISLLYAKTFPSRGGGGLVGELAPALPGLAAASEVGGVEVGGMGPARSALPGRVPGSIMGTAETTNLLLQAVERQQSARGSSSSHGGAGGGGGLPALTTSAGGGGGRSRPAPVTAEGSGPSVGYGGDSPLDDEDSDAI